MRMLRRRKMIEDSQSKEDAVAALGGSPCSPCPFCGYESLRIMEISESYRVICDCCCAAGPKMNNKDDAIARWNFREERSKNIMMEMDIKMLRDYFYAEQAWRNERDIAKSEDLRIIAARIARDILPNVAGEPQGRSQ
jgi:Lar family restriction alleviation protein